MSSSLPTMHSLQTGDCLGRGTYGDVFNGSLFFPVIIKRFAHISEYTYKNPKFVSLITTLTNLRHPNLTTCFCLNSLSVQLNTAKEFEGPGDFQYWDLAVERAQGTLETVLKSSREGGLPSFSFPTIATIFSGIVDCFVYLHDVARVTHGNLKFSNILISDCKSFPLLEDVATWGAPGKFTVKIGDLVSHKIAYFEEEDPRLQGVAGWMNYMAPEITRGNRNSFALDVYCFGNILWQLLSFKRDFLSSFSDPQSEIPKVPLDRPEILLEMQRKELDWLKLDLAMEIDKLRLVSVVEACWQFAPGLRPTFSGLAHWAKENLIQSPPPVQIPTPTPQS